MPAIASLDSRKYRGPQVMVSTVRKAKEGVKRHGRGYNSKLYSYTMAKLAPENMLLNAIPGAYRANKKPAKPIYARTLAYIKAKLKLRMDAGTNLPANRRPTGRSNS